MSQSRLAILTTLAMTAFAGNSLLCRAGLTHTDMDAASFTAVRLIAGAIALWIIVQLRSVSPQGKGTWLSALALFAYAAGFSFAYLTLPAGTGALLLFGAVQVTMIGHGILSGERLRGPQIAGIGLASAGLIGLLLPGLSAPPLAGGLLMLVAGISWGIYSLRGRSAGDPVQVTAGNFIRAVPVAVILSALTFRSSSLEVAGIAYAAASGALTSGIGYAIWYSALPGLKASHAATVQLSVPVIAAFGGILFLGEDLTMRLAIATVAILGGIALVILEKQRPATGTPGPG